MNNIILDKINELPESVLKRISISNSEFGITIKKGAMQVYLRAHSGEDVEISYESQLHEITTAIVSRDNLINFVTAVIDRDKLGEIDI